MEWFLLAMEQYGVWGLILITFLDSFISPVPPEVLFIPLSLAKPQNTVWLALVTTCTSVAGALVGYWLGLRGGRPLLYRFFRREKVKKAENLLQMYGVAAVLLASFTPIPFKIITISSGVLGLSLKKLLFWSTIGRGARFFLEAGLLVLYGYEAKKILEGSSFSVLTLIVAFGGLAIYLLYRHFR